MGTPREYGFNDISNENILKADPLPSFLNFFFFCGPPHSEWPHSASKLFSVGGKEGATTQVEHKPTVLPTRPTRHWPGPMLDSVGTRAWMTLTVPECIGNCRWCWDARALPSPAAPSPRPPAPFFPPDNLDGLPRGSDPEVVVAHVCFLGRLTCEWDRKINLYAARKQSRRSKCISYLLL